MNIAAINNLTADELEARLQKCCHCAAWAERVAGSAPFLTAGNLVECCSGQWLKATEEEILEAFSGHPQIGDMDALRNKYASTASAEQGQVTSADESVLLALRDQNQAYLEKFGFIFIVCATGKSASEMLALLEARINNSRDDELANGAREQGEIMKLRLEKLLEDD
jgi:2-oxo-4-hydroxy-4-carboxy-5-ureidoimidazoline decarboxylase